MLMFLGRVKCNLNEAQGVDKNATAHVGMSKTEPQLVKEQPENDGRMHCK